MQYLAENAGSGGVIEVGAGGGWVAYLLEELFNVDVVAYDGMDPAGSGARTYVAEWSRWSV